LKKFQLLKILNTPDFLTNHYRPKITKSEIQDWKCMMIVALWKKQIFAYEILPEGETVDSTAYLDFLERRILSEVDRKKIGRIYILHDNAPPHRHRIVNEFLQYKRWEVLDHPPYSPDMSPPDMDGIHRIKEKLKGKHFQTRDELIREVDQIIQDINKGHESTGIMMLPDRWRAITIARGKYVEH
jgi:transposase